MDALGNPLRIILGEGQAHDITFAPALIERICSTTVLADKGYDSNVFIAQLQSQGCSAIIPPRSNRKEPREYDSSTYKHRHLVENFFQRIKRYRRVATRYEKLSVTFEGMVLLASVLVLMR